MKVWDLHCDTLWQMLHAEQRGTPKTLADNDLMLDLTRMQQGDYLLQCFACYVDLEKDGDPLLTVLREIDLFYRQLALHPELTQVLTAADIAALTAGGGMGAMLTVEEGAVCKDDLAVLRDLYRLGVRMMTLTWNYPNGLAQPSVMPGTDGRTPNLTGGLTEQGRAFVAEMERLHMIVDAAHLSDAGIEDLFKITKRPFVASHSNARACSPHVRNLTDVFLRKMGERGCLVGLNYCGAFLDKSGTTAPSRIEDMIRHARHIIQVGGEDLLALGSDFDGITGPLELSGAQDMPKLAEAFAAAGFREELIEKIFYRNAARFFAENL